MRILHIIDSARPGGAEVLLASLVNNSPEGYSHGILVLNGSHDNEPTVLPRIVDRCDISFSLYTLPSNIATMKQFIVRFNPDVINLNLQMSYLFYFLFFRTCSRNVKVNVAVHALPSQIGYLWFIFMAFLRFFVNGYTVEDSIAKKTLLRFGVPCSMIRSIPLGTSFFERRSAEGACNNPYTKYYSPVFLNVARMIPGKGQQHLIVAFAKYYQKVNKGTLVIIGYGPLASRLKIFAKKQDLPDDAIIFPGKITCLTSWFSHADVYVSSSVDEGMGVVICDAMAAALPVIGFNAGTLNELVENGIHGILVKNRDCNLLTDALVDFSARTEYFRQMGRTGSIRMKQHHQSAEIARSTCIWFSDLTKDIVDV